MHPELYMHPLFTLLSMPVAMLCLLGPFNMVYQQGNCQSDMNLVSPYIIYKNNHPRRLTFSKEILVFGRFLEHQACPVLLNVDTQEDCRVTPASPASKPRTSIGATLRCHLSVRIRPMSRHGKQVRAFPAISIGAYLGHRTGSDL